jgi:hypothetical protein
VDFGLRSKFGANDDENQGEDIRRRGLIPNGKPGLASAVFQVNQLLTFVPRAPVGTRKHPGGNAPLKPKDTPHLSLSPFTTYAYIPPKKSGGNGWVLMKLPREQGLTLDIDYTKRHHCNLKTCSESFPGPGVDSHHRDMQATIIIKLSEINLC